MKRLPEKFKIERYFHVKENGGIKIVSERYRLILIKSTGEERVHSDDYISENKAYRKALNLHDVRW